MLYISICFSEMATLSSILAWKIPWTEEPWGLQSNGLQRVRHDWANIININNTWNKFVVWFSHEKEGNPAICNNMDGPWGHYIKWSKPDTERQLLYCVTYMWNLIETEIRKVVVKNCRLGEISKGW